ncbi:MAG: carbohydrate-binding domain-containing protein [Lachnospiraceae bacterium]|nr:carbohydrate-binding domain-containing protein [Lachnospiraceae bacterium]
MKNSKIIMAALLTFAMVLSACGQKQGTNGTNNNGNGSGGSNSSQNTSAEGEAASEETTASPIEYMRDDSKIAKGEFLVTSSSAGAKMDINGNVYTVKTSGEYLLSGNLKEGQVVVDASEGEVRLILNGVAITNSTDAPILVLDADKVDIESVKGTYNFIEDTRKAPADDNASANTGVNSTAAADPFDEDSETSDYNAAIYAMCDLKITGSGTLVVTSDAYHGIKTKDDLSVKEVSLQVNAAGNALRGNDTLTIKSGRMLLESTESDGIKTSNSDISSKGNQRGIITISGGQVDIYASKDGISSSYNVDISDAENCSVNIYTSTYAKDKDGEAAKSSDIYLIVPQSVYSDSTDYYAYYYNNDSDGKWVQLTYEAMVYGGRSSYYGLHGKVADGYEKIVFNTVKSGTVPNGENYSASSGGETVNDVLNAYLIESIDGSFISGDWVQLSAGNGSGTTKTTYSSKGIKAGNDVYITGGSIVIHSMDDGIHANSNNELENGTKSTGDIHIGGGSLIIYCADDAIHADNMIAISGGLIRVVDSHEGIEGNVINVSGGRTYLYGEDDGINAFKGKQTPLLNVTDGYLEVTTPSGDTDAVDSNGNVTVSGGMLLVRASSVSGGMAGSIDVDGSISVTGGNVVALGGIVSLPSEGSVNTYVSNGTNFAEGSYTLVDASGKTLISFALDKTYTSCWIASDSIELNGSYKLMKDGKEVLNWTQNQATSGSTVNLGMGGMRGDGGRRQ